MTQAAEDDSEELARFRDEWLAEVQRRKEEVQHHRANAPADTAHTAEPSAASAHANTAHAVPAKPSRGVHAPNASSSTREPTIDPASLPPKLVRALEVYGRAVACEQRSQIDEALRLYRIAFRIEDNVAYAYEAVLNYQRAQDRASGVVISAKREDVFDVEQVTQALGSVDISAELKVPSRVVDGTLTELVSEWPADLAFEPEDEKQPVSIQMLPGELFLKILRNLDTTSLERFATTSRKARVLTLDTSIWKRYLVSVFCQSQITEGEDISTLLLEKYKGDPRQMYIKHPRVRMDGVYIAVCHYIRQGAGESAWVNVSHHITYHRYLRFFPSGQVLSLLANEGEDPKQSIHKLQLSAREKRLYIGTWRLEATTVRISDLLEVIGETPKYTFQMTLDLRSRPLGRWNRLALTAYETIAIADGEASALPLKNERPFWFSKVRSYT